MITLSNIRILQNSTRKRLYVPTYLINDIERDLR